MKTGFRTLLAAALMLGAGRLSAAKTETVTYRSGRETVSGFLAAPEGGGRHPGLIVIHEWWGLNEWTKDRARKFAEEGYVALAIDLYRGQTADRDPDKAHQLMRGMPEDRAIRDLKAAFDYLAHRPDVEPSRIGSIGWCMGGGYSLETAVAEPKLAACVVYYGRLVTDPKTIEKIHAPILGSFGALDQGITPESVRAFDEAARGMGKKVDIKIYEGAGHGFASFADSPAYRPDAAKDADFRAEAFLKRYLRSR